MSSWLCLAFDMMVTYPQGDLKGLTNREDDWRSWAQAKVGSAEAGPSQVSDGLSRNQGRCAQVMCMSAQKLYSPF